MDDPSPTVRWVVCGCLQDFGDVRASAALLDRLKHDDDCQIRGAVANALGHIGDVERLPDLHQAFRTDHEVDQLGYTTSSLAEEAMTSILRSWVTRQIQGTPPRTFRESTSKGELAGSVTAEEILFDAEGSIHLAARYSHLPKSAFGCGWSSNMNLETTLVAPFEIEVQYIDPTCLIQRSLIYYSIPYCDDANWAVHTILDPQR